MRSRMRAALAGALVAPLTLGLLVALPFVSSLVLPRGASPSPTTEALVAYWSWTKFAGGAVWGIALALITGTSALRLGVAGLVGMLVGDSIVFGPLSASLAPLFVDREPYVEMAATFPLAVATVVVSTGVAFAIAARRIRRLAVLSLGAALAAAAAIVLTIAALDAIGVRTGTGVLAMPKVMVVGTLAACAVVGAIQTAALLPRLAQEDRSELEQLQQRA